MREERVIVRWPTIGGTRVKKKEWKIAMQRKIGENRSKKVREERVIVRWSTIGRTRVKKKVRND